MVATWERSDRAPCALVGRAPSEGRHLAFGGAPAWQADRRRVQDAPGGAGQVGRSDIDENSVNWRQALQITHKKTRKLRRI